MTKDLIEEDNRCKRKGDIKHTFKKQGELSVLLLFKEQTRGKSDNECYHYHPNSRPTHCFFPFHRLCNVNTYKENGCTAPKYLQMTYCFMQWGNIFYHNTPHHHNYRSPTIDRILGNKHHIKWTHKIENHNSWDIPER